MLVIDLKDLVDVTEDAETPLTVSVWTAPLASVPVIGKLLADSSPVNFSFKAWLVRRRSPADSSVNAPPAPTLCAGAIAVSDATIPTWNVPTPRLLALALTIDTLTVLASVIKIAGVPPVSALVVDNSAYMLMVLPPPYMRILPEPALYELVDWFDWLSMPPRPVRVIAPFEVRMLLLFCVACNKPLVEIVTAPALVVVVPLIVSCVVAPVADTDTGAPLCVSVTFMLTDRADPELDESWYPLAPL